MTRDTALRILLPSAIYLAFGWWIGSKLIAIPSFQTFKVLNVIGLTYDLFGVCVLSRFITSNEKYRSMVSGPVAEQFGGLVVFAGLGFILCGQFGPEGPSKARLEEYSIFAFMYFIVPTFMYVGHLVVGIERKPPWSEDTRSKLFGGFFLLGGILIQLYAAVLDLYS